MARNRTANPRLEQAKREFAEAFDAYLKQGQHGGDVPERHGRPWANVAFAGQVGASPNAIANWRDVASPIPPSDVVPILDALFGDISKFAGPRFRLLELWRRAKGLIPFAMTKKIRLRHCCRRIDASAAASRSIN